MVALPSPYLSKLYFLASLIAHSLASAPELAKKTLLMLAAFVNLLLSSTVTGFKKILEQCCNFAAWLEIAETHLGLLYPRQFTPIPLVKSIYSLPFVS